MAGRVHHAAVYDGLKTATGVTLRAFGPRPGEPAARAIGVRSGESLRQYADAAKGAFAPADVIADLEAFAPYPHVTAALAGAAGYLLVPGPDQLGEGAPHTAVAECGEAITAIATAYADRRCDHAEAPKARAEILGAILALLALDAEIAGQHPQTGPALSGGRP